MTLEQIQALTDDEIRVMVAELCGWKRRAWQDRKGRPCKSWTSPEGRDMAGMPPNYPADLNACAEAVASIPDDGSREKYLWALKRGIMRNSATQGADEFQVHSATARQRCEAFLATMEKDTP